MRCCLKAQATRSSKKPTHCPACLTMAALAAIALPTRGAFSTSMTSHAMPEDVMHPFEVVFAADDEELEVATATGSAGITAATAEDKSDADVCTS